MEAIKFEAQMISKGEVETVFINSKSINYKKHDDTIVIADMSAATFFLVTAFTYTNQTCTVAYKALDKEMGIWNCKNLEEINEENLNVYEKLLIETIEFVEFLMEHFSKK